MKNVVIKVLAESIAEEMGIEPGDILVDINGSTIKDVLDYRYLVADDYVEVTVQKPDGEEWVLEIEKDEYEDLGIVFESGLMDDVRRCSNQCIFCFIDQMPKNMRDTLYFKDDDSRLSFLQGNYVTLTNMKPADIESVIFYHLSPINISVHTTDSDLRKFMIKNKRANELMSHLEKFSAANIDMNFQIVLCKGVNDEAHLEKTIFDLSRFIPRGKSLSVVPIGLTKFRDGLYPATPFHKDDATRVLEQVHRWQATFLKEQGTRFVYAADEFYLKAEVPFPAYDAYEEFPQIENGVGMMSSMLHEFHACFDGLKGDETARQISMVTGVAALQVMNEITSAIKHKFINTEIQVYGIQNDFFGKNITVSGLLTGQDIVGQLKGKPLGDVLFIPQNCLRADDTVLLDDYSVADMEEQLHVPIRAFRSISEEWLTQILQDDHTEE